MVAYVTNRATTNGFKPPFKLPEMKNPLAKAAVQMVCMVPWESFLLNAASSGAGAAGTAMILKEEAPKPKRGRPRKGEEKNKKNNHAHHMGPGCQAADNALLTLGYLEGLSRGNAGFGVLALGKQRLEEGAAACDGIGHMDLGNQMREVANSLPHVHDKKSAKDAATKLKPLADVAWELGRSCKGSTAAMERIIDARRT